MPNGLFVMDKTMSNEMVYGNEVVLRYEVHFPHFQTHTAMPGLAKVNAWYKKQALHLVRTIRTEYYADAVADAKARRAEGVPFEPYAFVQSFTTTYDMDGLISLYEDTYQFTGGAHGTTVRTAQTWCMKTGDQIPLSALFQPGTYYVGAIEDQVMMQIHTQNQQEEGAYFENSGMLVREAFDVDNFYLVPQYLTVFFQQAEIAPYAAGIPTFAIRYRDVGARVPRC